MDDPDDSRIIECALAAGSTHVLTNDKALLRVDYAGISMVKPDEFFTLSSER